MTAAAHDIGGFPFRGHGRANVLVLEAVQAIGAAGAVGTLDKDDPGVTVAKNASTGTYDITYPKCVKARIYWALISAAGTVKTAWIAALSATAGTAQLVTGNGGGTATNPADGDKIQLLFLLETN